jgi:hypothetical protein
VGALGNNPNAAVVTSGAALVLGSILSLAAIGTHFTFLMYLRRLALRIPNQKLANAARIVMCGFVICMGVLLLAGVLVAALASRNQGGGGGGPALGTAGSGATGSGMMGVGVFGFFACFGGAGLIVFQIWYLIMLVRFRSAFREAELAAIRFAVHRPRVIPPPPGGGETGSGSGETG